MKKVMIRIYKRHDIDLVTIFKTQDVSLRKIIYNSLKAYVNKKPYLIKVPLATEDMTSCKFKSNYQIILNLNEKKDADIIEWLKNIKKGMRNIAIKTVVRGCILGTVVYACLDNDEDRLMNNILCEQIYKDIPVIHETPIKVETKSKKTNIPKEAAKKLSKKAKIVKDIDNISKVTNEIKDIDETSIISNTKPSIIQDVKEEVDFDTLFESNSSIENKEDKESTFDLFGSVNSLLDQF